MSFLSSVIEAIRPAEVYRDPKDKQADPMQGTCESTDGFRYFSKMAESIRNMNRAEFLKSVLDMSDDFALADKTLEKLCQDATANPVKIDAPIRRKKIIQDFLNLIKYEDHRKSWIYLTLRDGDSFFQKSHTESIQAGRIAYISSVCRLPTDTMIRNTNERDEFESTREAFIQVPHITMWPPTRTIPKDWTIFPYAKIHHARNDWEQSKYFRYGRSIWASAVRVFNMCVMSLEDSAIQRHQNTQNVTYHMINKHSDVRATDTFIDAYATKFKEMFSANTEHMFIDGKNDVTQLGGTKSIMSSIEDIRLILSVLAIALDYPLDLLSLGLTGDSGGEELFRKEVVLKRTIENIIDRENKFILRPLIDSELALAGDTKGKYRITTFPTTFEDANKKSKRGVVEVQGHLKSRRSYHEENNPEISWEEERARIGEDLDWEKEVGLFPSQFTRANPTSGEQGSQLDPVDQQERKTPGGLGTDAREDD